MTCGHMRHFMAQRFGFDLHLVCNAGHFIDLERMRTSNIYDHGRFDSLARFKCNATHPAIILLNAGDASVEFEHAASRFRRALNIVRIS